MLDDYNPVYDEDLELCESIMKAVTQQCIYENENQSTGDGRQKSCTDAGTRAGGGECCGYGRYERGAERHDYAGNVNNAVFFLGGRWYN